MNWIAEEWPSVVAFFIVILAFAFPVSMVIAQYRSALNANSSDRAARRGIIWWRFFYIAFCIVIGFCLLTDAVLYNG